MSESFDEASARVKALFGDKISVKSTKAPVEDSDNEYVDSITRVCYFYPQYTIEQAEQLADSQVQALLLQAEKQRAINLYNMTLIAAAPYSKKGKLVKDLSKKYKEIIDS